MTEHLISADRVSKIYRVFGRPWDRVREMVTGKVHHRAVPALEDVSFTLRRSESLGVLGQNGAGKSTLLGLLAGVITPTRGELRVRGKVASLLELGMGFHPDFTGRQNIRLNAAMLGLSEAEVEEKTPEIIDFSELGEFIERPVKTYSTGMTMRLGFSIAVQVEPEILIIDEALSVGDGYFQKKCMDRIRDFIATGRTLLFCSHALYYISAFCERALWLRRGQVAALGPVEEVVREYEHFLLRKDEQRKAAEEASREAEPAEKPGRIVAVRQLGREGRRPVYRHREPWSLEIEWRSEDPGLGFHVAVGIDRVDDVQICSIGTHRDGLPPRTGERHYRTVLTLPTLPLLKGEFNLYVFLLDEEGLHVYDQRLLLSAFRVDSADFQIGLIQVEHRWEGAVAPLPVAEEASAAAG
jgi:ABC-type polysaccharide/polyol phosphate transport system ATPase subunit